MSDFDTGADYGHVEAGQEHESLDQLHQVEGSENDYNSQFGVYEQDHASAESTSFDQGHHVEYSNPRCALRGVGLHLSTTTTRPRPTTSSPPRARESSHASEFGQLDALQHQLDTSFASATELHTGGAGELGVASN